METREQSLNPVSEDQTLPKASEAEASAPEKSVDNTIETVGISGVDPEKAAEDIMSEGERETEADKAAPTKESLLAAAEELAARDAADIRREDVSRIRKQFSDLRAAEIAAEREEYYKSVEGVEDVAPFQAAEDASELRLHEILNVIKGKKSAWVAEQEALRAANLERKQAVVEEINKLAADTDNVNRTYPRFQELRQDFLAIGEATPSAESDIQRAFKDAQERYYDQLKVNKDLRDYDFKKNLDSKMLLIDEAKRLVSEPDVITAFRRLQELHDKWRQTGPVAKEKREEIWGEFKDISAEINKRYQAHFEERKAEELRNEQAKTAICERIEALDYTQIKNYAGWDDLTKVIIEAQAEWKTLGFASKKMNNMLFARFRDTCDKFFAAKAEYFKSTKEALSANLAKKISLCERAEALKDSTDWRKTSDELVELQKEWKTIGAVPKKHSDSVWRRFQTACDAFFDAKKAATSGVRSTQQANLKAKREIIEALGNIAADAPREEAVKAIKELQAKWNQIGHVPFRDKDKIYDAYREKVNGLYSRLNMRESRENFAGFESSLEGISGDENRLYRERERLMRAFEQKRAELQTVENNMGFFSSKSKAGESMMRELQHRVQRVKDDLEMLEKKIALIDSKL